MALRKVKELPATKQIIPNMVACMQEEQLQMPEGEVIFIIAVAVAVVMEETLCRGTGMAFLIIQVLTGISHGNFNTPDFLPKFLPEEDKVAILFPQAIKIRPLLVLTMRHG